VKRLPLVLLCTVLAAGACSGSAPSAGSGGPKTSLLSGRPGVADGPALAVKVDNTARAHPQVGVDAADVVYVEEVEGGLTRLAAIYSSS